jgi:hypothetical protein
MEREMSTIDKPDFGAALTLGRSAVDFLHQSPFSE